jgi:hypothetical protein
VRTRLEQGFLAPLCGRNGDKTSLRPKGRLPGQTRLGIGSACLAATLAGALPTTASAQRIENASAVFAALDKVTARISKLEIKLNESVRFGALKVTPRVCYTRAPTEPPKTTTFVEVDEVQLDGNEKRIFTGWMFADSPGLNAVEHPVFDVWLTECAQPLRTSGGPQKGAPSAQRGQPSGESGDDDTGYRRRPRR